MSAGVLVARLLLTAVFAAAVLAKLADRAGTRRAVVAFGVPSSLASIVSVAVPVAELAVAVLLVPSTTAIAGAVSALAR